MIPIVLRRVPQMIIVLLLSTMVIFVLIRLTPGDPAQALAGVNASPQAVQAIRHQLALDQPIPVQYGVWLWHLLHLDLGTSIFSGRTVTSLIAARLPATGELALGAIIIMVVFGGVVGLLGAAFQGSRLDTVITVVTSFLIGIPPFWLGLLGLIAFSLELHWLPAGGWVDVTADPVAGLRSLALPCSVLGVVQGSVVARFVRGSTVEALSADYIQTARAKGVPIPTVVWRHAFRNGLLPVVTVLGLLVGNMIGGVVILELVFSWPGVGRLLIDAVQSRDYPVIQGVLLLLIFSFVFINLLVDLAYSVLDPRTRT